MNILLANWSWFPSGGDWTYIDSICKLYTEKGHTIIPFSQQDNRNLDTPYSKYFVSKIDYESINKKKNLNNSIQVVTKAIYSFEAKRNLEQLLNENQVDIVQLNIINNSLTPSIIKACKDRNIPIVWRILQYKPICPNAYFYSKEKICESCKVKKYYMCTLKKCVKKSYSASLVATIESYLYSVVKYYDYVDLFLFQGNFSRNKFVEYGIDKNKTFIVGNPLELKDIHPVYNNENFILFFGRLEKIKGVSTLLQAMKFLPDIKLKIIGIGNDESTFIEYVKSNNLENIEFLGHRWHAELNNILVKAAFVVVPSEWYEVSPYSIIQSFAYGKPVIGSNLAGISDLIENNVNGLLFEPGDSDALKDKIRFLFYNQALIKEFGQKARAKIEKFHSSEFYYNQTISEFHKLLNK